MSSVLDRIADTTEIKKLTASELGELARELRSEMIQSTSRNGGHLAPSLGAVEIVMAAHRALDLADGDKLLFDVGHQSYAHKLLTGRREGFSRLRKVDGVSGFTRRSESPFDVHDAGHASDSIATAAGLALARDLDGSQEAIVTVIGDASIAGGLANEALNFVGQQQFKRFVIILNDNEMSISPSVGALSTYLATIRTSRKYNTVRDSVEGGLSKTGKVGDALVRLGERAKEATKQFLVPGMLFEDMGITYLGPIDGHDVGLVQETLERALGMTRPVIIHAVTKKGLGYLPAEANPEKFHGVGPFDITTGDLVKTDGVKPSYTKVFSECLIQEASQNEDIVAITAAMPSGTGVYEFIQRFPDRAFDVGIAEECAVTLASGLALKGKVPVVALYSTFLQRAFDEAATNVCLQNLHVVFAVDRAGLVGEDGSTHHGAFDLAYLRLLPNISIAAPSSADELRLAMHAALRADGPVAVRYPRGSAVFEDDPAVEALPGSSLVRFKSEVRGAKTVSFLAIGRMVWPAMEAARILESHGIAATVYDMRWVKPLDMQAIFDASKSDLVVTVEDGTIVGGFGSAVAEALFECNAASGLLRLGLPDAFVGHGSTDGLFADLGLNAPGMVSSVMDKLSTMEHGCRE